MDDDRAVQPWPRWVRYPIITFLAALMVVGLVEMARGAVGGDVLRVVAVKVLVPVLAIPLVLTAQLRGGRRARHWTDESRDAVAARSAAQAGATARDPRVDRVYREASALAREASDADCRDYSKRIDEIVAAGTTTTETLLGVRRVCDELVRQLPGHSHDLRGRVDSLRLDIDRLLDAR